MRRIRRAQRRSGLDVPRVLTRDEERMLHWVENTHPIEVARRLLKRRREVQTGRRKYRELLAALHHVRDQRDEARSEVEFLRHRCWQLEHEKHDWEFYD